MLDLLNKLQHEKGDFEEFLEQTNKLTGKSNFMKFGTQIENNKICGSFKFKKQKREPISHLTGVYSYALKQRKLATMEESIYDYSSSHKLDMKKKRISEPAKNNNRSKNSRKNLLNNEEEGFRYTLISLITYLIRFIKYA